MKSKVIKNIFLLMITIVCSVQSKQSIAGLPGAPMRMGFGARGIAMGNSLSAVISGDVGAYYNPAVTPFQYMPNLNVSYGILSLDRTLNYVSYTQHLEPTAGASLSIINAGVSGIDGRNTDGMHTAELSTSENDVMFSFGLKVLPTLSIGFTANVFIYHLYGDVSSTTGAFDLGAVYLLSKEVTLATVVQHMNAKYKWNTTELYGIYGNATEEYFPLRFRIGASYFSENFPLLISSEFESINGALFLRSGIEYKINNQILLRAGLDQISLNTDDKVKPSFGFSVMEKFSGITPSLEYAFVIENSFSSIHILSLYVRF